MDFRGDSYSHLMDHGGYRRGQSNISQKYVESGGCTLSDNSVCDDGGSMVDHICEETPLEACDGMRLVWSLHDYSDSPLTHRDEFHRVVHSLNINL
jgi:hypothetical protein